MKKSKLIQPENQSSATIVAVADSPLSTTEAIVLADCERVIERGQRVFLDTASGAAAQFLAALFPPGDTVVFRPIETWIDGGKKCSRVDYGGVTYHTMGLGVGRGRRVAFPARTVSAIARIAERAAIEKTNTFFGVAPRFAPGGEHLGTSYDLAWQVRIVRCLWSDIDDVPDVATALTRCSTAGLPEPSIVVASGHGAHLYWLLQVGALIDSSHPDPVFTEFIDRGEKKKRRRQYVLGEHGEKNYLDVPTHRPGLLPGAQRIQDTLAGIAAAIGGDHTTDLSRLLRVPGTQNRKNERNGTTPVPCEMIVFEPGRRYPLSAFARWEQSSPQKIDRERIAKIPLPRAAKLGKRGQKTLDTLIAACLAADPGTRSEADFALCCWAVEQGQSADAIWQAAAGVGKFAEAGERYFDRTWDKAVQHTRERIFDKASAKGRKKSAKAKGMAAEGDKGKPIIIIDTDEGRVVDEAISALATEENIYQRGGLLVQVVEGGDSPKGIDRPKDGPHIAPMKHARIRELLATAAEWIKPAEGEGESSPAHPPDWAVRAVDARGQWTGIRRLTAVVEMPTLRADGSILSQPGYDLATGIILRTDTPFTPPARPTKDDAVAAVKALLEVVEDFPFAKAEHRTAWLAGTITPVARYAYHGPAPLTLIDANVRGCGKTLLTDATSLIVSARDMARMSLPRDDDELRKRITALAIAGEPLILIDNIVGTLGSPSLDAALTATSWSDRILGETAMASGLPMYACWYSTGNNVILAADTSRRTLHIRLESPEENPEGRTDFRHAYLLAWVRAERPRLATAAVTVLAAYCVAGKPNQGLRPWGSFEGWSDLVRSALVWAGQPDPAETRIELASQADREAAALRQLLLGWSEIDAAGTGKTVVEVLRELAENSSDYETLRTALWELCPPRDGKTFNPRSIGGKFHHLRNRVIGGRFLARRDTNMGAVWSVKDSCKGGVASDSKGSSDSSTGYVTREEKTLPNQEKQKHAVAGDTVTTAPTVTCPHLDVEETPTGDGRYYNRTCRRCGEPLRCRAAGVTV
jgi:hypothetical protein